jgi:hypothetical protein
MELCCSVRCSCNAYGGFVYLDCIGQSIISHSSSISSRASGDFFGVGLGDGGAICVNSASTTVFTHVNFTTCHALVGGSALNVRNASAQWNASHLTVIGQTGKTGIESNCLNLPRITHSNFYLNTNLSDAVLRGGSSGMIVDSCIFNTNSRILSMGTTTGQRFELLNNVFAESIPTESEWVTLMTGNLGYCETASFFLIHIDTADCPGNTVSPAPSPLYSVSPLPSPSSSHPFFRSGFLLCSASARRQMHRPVRDVPHRLSSIPRKHLPPADSTSISPESQPALLDLH